MSQHIAIFALVAFCLSTLVVVEAALATRKMLEIQKSVYDLLWRVNQPEMKPELYALGESYSMEAHLADYTHKGYVEEFLRRDKAHMLPRGEIFSVFYPTMLDQAVALFRVFNCSKDFSTLYKTAAWARIYMNEGLFAYAFSVAVTHHKNTQQIRVPAYHEINPHLYFDDQVIRQAYNIKTSTAPESLASGEWTIIPESNPSFHHLNDPNYVVNYYTDDIALNDAQYFAHLQHPFWMSAKESKLISSRRGELYLRARGEELARYSMEVYSNELGDIEDFDLNHRIPYGFIPSVSYENGTSLPHREKNSYIPSYNYESLNALRDIDYRISTAIDTGRVTSKNGTSSLIRTPDLFNVLGNLIEGNSDSHNTDVYRSYDRMARSLLGFSPKPFNDYKVFPSVMQYFGLDQRDPMYWSLSKKIVGWLDRITSKLPAYTEQELNYPGVKIESVVVDKITTSFTHYDYLISGAVKLHSADDKALIKASQKRLTHEPFNYTITVSSESAALNNNIRIFLALRKEKIDIGENYKDFYLIDEFLVDFRVGINTFKRSSLNARAGTRDEVSGDVFYAKILSALAGNETYEVPDQLYGNPRRMLIPKGERGGMPMQFFFFVGPSSNEDPQHSRALLIGDTSTSLQFPIDRPRVFNFTDLPNAYFLDFDVSM